MTRGMVIAGALFVAAMAVASCGAERPAPAGDVGFEAGVGDAAVGDSGAAADGADASTTQCTNGIDDDGDGLVDALDPECTGPFDNDERSFGSGITSDNADPCKQDCFFDGNSGQGDDGCDWDLGCDPLRPGGAACDRDGGTTAPECSAQQSDRCREKCSARSPNGCDCFGCCAFTVGGVEAHVRLTSTCTSATLGDPSKCVRCTPVPSCANPCEECELCTGKTTLPPSCTSGPTCPSGTPGCGADGACPLGTYCVTGCCQVVVR